MNNATLILAGGLGSRLGELVREVPKPMLPVNGLPFISYLIMDLMEQGLKEIFISTGYQSHVFEEYFSKGEFSQGNVKIIREVEPLGTGGAVKQFLELYPSCDSLFVVNGDTFVFGRDYNITLHTNKDWLLVTTVEEVSSSGKVLTDSNSKIKNLSEKSCSGPGLINAGTYHFSQPRRILKLMSEYGCSFSLEDFLSIYTRSNSVYCIHTFGEMVDMGTPSNLEYIKKLLRK